MPFLRYRKLSVQDQNALVEDSIRNQAMYWRLNPLPEALTAAGVERGIQWDRSIVLELDIDFPGLLPLCGLLLTQDQRFIEFAIDTDKTHRIVGSVDTWKDVTATQNTSERNRGFGAGRGALAIKVLRELNALKESKACSHENDAL